MNAKELQFVQKIVLLRRDIIWIACAARDSLIPD
jgi:hypothetical protein